MLLAPKKVEFSEANTCFFSVVCFKKAKILHILEFFQARRLKKIFLKNDDNSYHYKKFSICSSLWWCAWGAEDIFEVLYKGRSGVLHKWRNGLLPETRLPAKKKMKITPCSTWLQPIYRPVNTQKFDFGYLPIPPPFTKYIISSLTK